MKNLNILVETIKVQKVRILLNIFILQNKSEYEDGLKISKTTIAKLEEKLQTGINEINKGNEIIRKLQVRYYKIIYA